MASSKKNKILWWIIGLGGAALLFSQLNPPAPAPTPTPDPTPTPGGGGSSSRPDFPIVYNRYSSRAKELQRVLNVTQDGIIGPKSLLALKFYFPDYTVAFKIANETELASLIYLIQRAQEIYNTTPAPVYDRRIGVIA